MGQAADTDACTGDKSNHVPATHVPQLFYFIAFATMAGWPALISGPGGLTGLVKEVRWRMFGTSRYACDLQILE